MKEFFLGRAQSLVFALRGAWLLISTEHAIMVHSFVAVVYTLLGFCFTITNTEWILQFLAIGLVLSVEALNTVAEKLCDFIHPNFHDKIGFIKDISAGAVTFAVGAASIIQFLIYYPNIF